MVKRAIPSITENMLDHNDVDDISGSSPTTTSPLAEGSELFRAVMEDFIKENQQTRNNNRDISCNNSNDRKTSNLCRRCLNVKLPCKCKMVKTYSTCRTGHRVQWADELSDGQLAREHRIDCDSPLSCSAPIDVTDSIKSILKHRANCIIIVAE